MSECIIRKTKSYDGVGLGEGEDVGDGVGVGVGEGGVGEGVGVGERGVLEESLKYMLLIRGFETVKIERGLQCYEHIATKSGIRWNGSWRRRRSGRG